MGLGDPDGDDLDAGCVPIALLLDGPLEVLVQLIELGDVDLVESVLGAELVDLVMDLVEDPGLVIVDGVVLDGLVGQVSLESIDHLYLIEVEHKASTGATGNVSDLVGLHCDLHLVQLGHQRHFHVESRATLS